MPVGFNSAARNLFLLGSTGAQVVSNFFKRIDQSTKTDGVYLPDEIRFNALDAKFLLAGSASDSNLKNFGWFEKRNTGGTADWDVRVEATQAGINTTLRAMELDSNNNLIVVGKTGGIPWIAKYDNDGVIDWQSTTNSGDVEYTGITSDSNGNYYACGSTPISGEATAFVEKFDASGTPGWGKAAFMLGRDVVFNKVAANNRGEVVAVGYLEDDSSDKGYIVKIDTTTGEVLWDRTLDDNSTDPVVCNDVFIDNNDQIYVVGNVGIKSYIIKYTAEGNIIWQKFSANTSDTITYDNVKSDSETEQTIVFGTYDDGFDRAGILTKYSKNGDLVWRRILYSSFNFTDTFSNVNLDADPSFYYILFTDGEINELNGTPFSYTFGKVSSSGNGLGNFEYFDGSGETIYYEIIGTGDEIGRLTDGSIRNDSSDLITYPFSANKLLFDDLATQVSNKKRQMDSADSFEYSGSPAIRPADFVTREYTTDGYGVPPQKNYISLSETLQPTSTNASGTTNNTWSRQTTNVTVTPNVIASPIGVGSMAEKYNISAAAGRRLEYGVPSGVFIAGQPYTFSWWMKAITTNAEWQFQTFSVGNSDNSIRIADKDGNILENISTSKAYKPKDTEWHRVVWTFTVNTTTGSPIGGYNSNNETGDLWYLWGAQLVDGPDPLKYYRNYTSTPENAAGTEHAPSITAGATYSFDQTETLQIGEIPGDFSQMTVEIWFKSSTFSNWQNPIDCNYATQDLDGNGAANSGNVGPRLEINSSGQIIWYWGSSLAANDPKSASVITTISTNTWYHSVLSISGAGMGDAEFFLNGSSVGINNNAGGGSWIGIIRNLVLGRGFSNGDRPFNGEIGELRIYPRALTPAQVFQNYNATKSKYINEAPDTAPKIGPGIVYDSNLLLNYDFGNRATYDTAENLIAWSEDYSNWAGKTDITIENNSIISPIGSINASKIINGNFTGSNAIVYLGIGPFTTTGETYCFSFYVKSTDGSSGTWGVNYYDGGGHNRQVVNVTDEWNRVFFTFNAVAGDGNIYICDNRSEFGNLSEVYVWGAQLEKGSTPGRYIKTSGNTIAAPTTVKNLSSTSYTNTIPSGVVYNSGVLEHNQAPLIFNPGVSHNSNINGFTWEIWIALDSTPTGDTYIFSADSNNLSTSEGLRIETDRKVWFQRTNSTATAVGVTLGIGNWNHFVVTMTGPQGLTLIYHNGTEELANSGSSSFDPQQLSSVGSNLFTGKVAEIRVYDRRLNASEVLQNFNATRSKYGV